jgi:type IV pilus assembly protein PilY1
MRTPKNYLLPLSSTAAGRLGQRIAKLLASIALIVGPALALPAIAATTPLSDQPLRATTGIPANVLLALSVEWPTGVVQAYNDEATGGCPGRDARGDSVCYFATKTYIGYFDPFKCYTVTANVFTISGYTNGATSASPKNGDHSCSDAWSGNFLNWATMQTTDEFRWAMTGGDRFVDTATETVLEKARHDGQGGFAQFPIKRVGGAAVGALTPVAPSTVMPASVHGGAAEIFIRINGLNTMMWVSANRSVLVDNGPAALPAEPANAPNYVLPANSLPATVNFTEAGTCADYIAAGGTGTCTLVSSDAGIRTVVIPTSVVEAGQCPSPTAGTCTNTTAPSAGTRQIVRDENGSCPAAGAVACSNQSAGTRQYNITEPGQCNPPTPPGGTTYGTCTNETAPRRRVVRAENGTCAAAAPGFVACADTSAGTRSFVVEENGRCGGLPAPPPGVTFSGCTNRAGGKRRYTRAEAGQCASLVSPGGGTTYTGCTNTSSPTRQVTRDENGVCPVVGSVSCTALSAGTRRYNVTNAGQCPAPVVGGVTVNSCTNQTSPTRRVTINQGGVCPVAGTVSCTEQTPATPGTRTITNTITRDEEGQCAGYVVILPGGSCTDKTAPAAADSRRITNVAPSPTIKPFFVRVKVCDPTNPETQTTCKKYGTSYKPEGLIQENSLKMRFGAFGYLLDNNQLRDGGVLRARMKDVGPEKLVPGLPNAPNSRKEWSETDGTYVNNPDAADATATGYGAVNSGVTQYLNKFGRRGGYKSFDPYSELYAEAIKYYKGKQSTPEYSSGLDATKVDGFPVITNWIRDREDDPIQYSCQQNFIVGIADSNTHKDKNLSGGISAAENEPASQPANVDTDYNVVTETTKVGGLESPVLPNLATYRNCCNGSAYLAGLAYYAHTTDLRPDFTNANGKQTITSYFVDVREAGSWGTSGDPRNQLWLAAKFGGFQFSSDEATGNVDIKFEPTRVWADPDAGLVQGYKVPTNYFAANQPDKLVSGLRKTFSNINAKTASAAGGTLASTDTSVLGTGNAIYKVQYSPKDWSGNVQGITLNDLSTDGTFIQTVVWNADAKLEEQLGTNGANFNTGRNVITAVPGGSQLGQPFRFANLNASQKAALGASATEQQEIVDYLRGDRTKETLLADGTLNPGGKYRSRKVTITDTAITHPIFGDIVDSEVAYVGAPSFGYLDPFHPGYAAFKTANAGRRPLLYVGANDGMLHAIDARTDGNALGGTEVFAYIPSFVYQGPNGNPSADGIRTLANSPLNHRYFVNATPVAADVDFDRTGSTPNGTGTPDWRSILVGGLGKGGKGFYALDVTDPSALTSEAGAAAKVLWEFTDEDMGFSYGLPVVAKVRRWGWVVLLTSGYNNITGPDAAKRGKGFLYVLNPKTGALLSKVQLGGLSAADGSAATPSGFAQISEYFPTIGEALTDEVYGGDLLGNVWRIDFKSETADPSAIKFASLTDSATTPAPQPITTKPLIDFSQSDKKRYVFVGTGRYLDATDTLSPQVQSFYALRDGSQAARFEPSPASTVGSDLPVGATFPITRAQLAANNTLADGLTAAEIQDKPMGWVYDLKGVTTVGAARERMTVNPGGNGLGEVFWVGTLPETDACNPNGVSFLYQARYGTGRSTQFTTDASGNISRTESLRISEALKVTSVNIAGKDAVLASGTGAAISAYNLRELGGAGRPLNWREILD